MGSLEEVGIYMCILVYSETSFNPDALGTIPSVLFSEVSSFQRLNNTQLYYLGLQQLSSLLRCPYFRGF